MFPRVRVKASVEVARARQEVWDFVADPTNDPLWCRKVKSVEQAGPDCWTLIHKPVPFRPAVELRVERLVSEPPVRLMLREVDDASVFDVEYRLVSTDEGTRFTQISSFEWQKLPRILHGLAARGVRRDVRGQVRALKEVLEAQPHR